MRVESQESSYWPEGKILPGGYRVAGRLGQGGMGIVYQVERRVSLKIHKYAVKTLIPNISENAGRRRDFLRELRTWIDLPEHPNLVSCRFFRTFENRLAIFAEYVEGDSLDKWIKNNTNAPLDTLLGMAIQMAWGLNFAHQCGVIHQDIKPSNILVSINGTVKITDFGLSRSRQHGRWSQSPDESDKTLMVSSRGMTMPFCSPEQAEGRKLSRKTDMWSYGLTVLAMFNGGLSWRLGSSAALALNAYLANGPMRPMPRMPEGVVSILRRCFEEIPTDRWSSIDEIATRLLEQYRTNCGSPYILDPPEIEVGDSSKSLNDERSIPSGSTWKDPVECYRKALEMKGCDNEFNTDDLPRMNHTSQRARALRDIEIYQMAEVIYRDLIKNGDTRKEVSMNLGRILFYSAQATTACQDLAQALELYQKAIKVLEGVDRVEARELRNTCWQNGSIYWFLSRQDDTAQQWLDAAIEDTRKLLAEEINAGRCRTLTTCLMNKASMLINQNLFDDVLTLLEEAQQLCEELLEMAGNDKNWNLMGKIQANLGMSYFGAKQYDLSMDAFNQAEDIVQLHVEKQNSYEVATNLGYYSFFKARILRRTHRLDQAVTLLVDMIAYMENQIKIEKREDLRIQLAEFREILAEVYFAQDRYDESLVSIDDAEKMLERIVTEEDQNQNDVLYARIALKAFVMFYAVGQRDLAMQRGIGTLLLWRQIAEDREWSPENILENMDKVVAELLENLDYFNKEDVAVKIRRAIHTMGKKLV